MFKRTHQDRWESDYKHRFTRDQLEDLQVRVSPYLGPYEAPYVGPWCGLYLTNSRTSRARAQRTTSPRQLAAAAAMAWYPVRVQRGGGALLLLKRHHRPGTWCSGRHCFTRRKDRWWLDRERGAEAVQSFFAGGDRRGSGGMIGIYR